MHIGDIVKIVDWKGSKPDSRKSGKVLRINGRHVWTKKDEVLRGCTLAEVMWQDGHVGWVAAKRLEKSNI
jgi:hypothetical protein|tara:strand:+ start:712 stop:921 length:210 start_codon:yes stop_codon:yes gene_type:complete